MVAAGTPVQVAIKVVLNYSDATRSVMGSDLGPEEAPNDTVLWPYETNSSTDLIKIERVVRSA